MKTITMTTDSNDGLIGLLCTVIFFTFSKFFAAIGHITASDMASYLTCMSAVTVMVINIPKAYKVVTDWVKKYV